MNPPIKNKLLRTFVSFLFILYILILLKYILFKEPGNLKTHFIDDYNWELVKSNLATSNYIPFYTAKFYITGTNSMRYSTENLFGNIILFFPFGIFLPLLFNKTGRLSKIIFTVFVISFCLELIQLVTVLGNFDTDDIILNIVGSFIGFGVYKILAIVGQT